MRWLIHLGVVIFLTALTQLGGIAYVVALIAPRRKVAVFAGAYGAVWIAAVTLAPLAGREPLPCFGEPLRMQSPFYCATLRHFVTPQMAEVAQDAAREVAAAHPGTITLALDGSLPFLTGFPLIPHLSHDDGEKLDLAFFYRDEDGYVRGQTRSPIGYFAFETLGVQTCPSAFPTMRWDLHGVQWLWRDWDVEPDRTVTLIEALASDDRVAKIFVEPPLAARLGVSGGKLRFQGCRAARHDDHIHVQL